jgi:hypothetical protein
MNQQREHFIVETYFFYILENWYHYWISQHYHTSFYRYLAKRVSKPTGMYWLHNSGTINSKLESRKK